MKAFNNEQLELTQGKDEEKIISKIIMNLNVRIKIINLLSEIAILC